MSAPVSVDWRTYPWGRSYRVEVECPGCGEKYPLDHQIATDGTITPSLECPSPSCNWHEMAKLDGWAPP